MEKTKAGFWIFVGGFLYALFFVQGLPLWDEDYAGVLRHIANTSRPYTIWHSLGEWLSPIARHGRSWGFREEPLQALMYQLSYAISGFEAWSSFLFKSVAYGGLGLLIYLWGRRLAPRASIAAVAAAVFFLISPGPIGAQIIHSDFAPFSQLILLMLSFLLWREVERTPVDWRGFATLDQRGQRHWLIRWSLFCGLAYLGYKSRAEVRLLPVIFAFYIGFTRPAQWRLFLYPTALMTFLAFPWGNSLFQGALHAPSLERLGDFLWTVGSSSFSEPTLSLSGVMGPSFLVLAVLLGVWKVREARRGDRQHIAAATTRARIFVLLWFVAALVWASMLPPVNYIFGIRYGIIPMVPASLLLAWFLCELVVASSHFPRWVFVAGLTAVFFQGTVNLSRSIQLRRELGQVMVAVDQGYDYFNRKFSSYELGLLPDFLSYEYRPDAAPSLAARKRLARIEDLQGQAKPFRTYLLSWKPSLWPEVEVVQQFSGCRESSLFDAIFPCEPGSGTVLMRHIGADPLFREGMEKRKQGDLAGARKLHEEFVDRHPFSLAGLYLLGDEAVALKDWAAAHATFSRLEAVLPDEPSVLLPHLRVLRELKLNREAKAALHHLKLLFPDDPEVIRLSSEESKG